MLTRQTMAPVHLSLLMAVSLLGFAKAQMAGKSQEEEHPAMAFSSCSKTGCVTDSTSLTMDSQWRWLHDKHSRNCIQGNKWVVDADTCGTECAVEGISKSDYHKTYGVSEVEGGVRLKYVNGQSIGSRLYMMEEPGTYKMFKLLNREFSFEVDVSSLACGLNGAVYFVEMEADGGLGQGTNKAGAKFGTGYCDAQCPHDLKFINGECNLKGWHMTPTGPVGHYGSCCSELDIWEANAYATAFTAHPCETIGPKRCEGDGEPNACGDTPADCDCCGTPDNCPCCGRYLGMCDRDGCDYNSYRLGNKTFFGKGPGFTVDSSRKMTVVTQFITSDGTDAGHLVEIRRLYVQDGKIINNSVALNVGDEKVDSVTDKFCSSQKKAFDNTNDFRKKGQLMAMGEAMRRGLVLVLSLWDDALTKMVWLDSSKVEGGQSPSSPGVTRGPCSADSGDPEELRSQHPDASVTYTNIRVGELGTTFGPHYQPPPSTGLAGPAVGAAQPPAPMPVMNTGQVAQVAVVATVQPPALAPAPAPVPASSSIATPVCCSSAQGNDKCGACWKNSVLDQGYCATEATCASCGGQWCPNGVVFAQAYEEGETPVAKPGRTASYAVWSLSAGVALLWVAGAVWLRAWRRTGGLSRGELELLYEGTPGDAGA